MNTISEYGYSILRFNYIIVFFSSITLLYFLVTTILKIFEERADFSNILEAADEMCVKFDHNGLILDYTERFAKIATFNNENIIGLDIFTLISFDDYDSLYETLFNHVNSDLMNNFTVTVTCRNGDKRRIRFRGIQNSSFFGAKESYILVGYDVTASEHSEREQIYNKQLLEKLTNDYRFAEEELKRNFQQIHDTKNEIDALRLKHKAFVDNLPLSIMEYDFTTRQLSYSTKTIKFFIPNANSSSIHPDEALSVFYNFIQKDSILDGLEAFYNAMHNRLTTFSFMLKLNSNAVNIRCSSNIQYINNEPSYMYIIMDFINKD